MNQDTRAVLINALYFKANWSSKFALTEKSDFFRTPTDSIQVDTLYNYQVDFNFYECPHLKAQFLELPFEGNGASMVIVLPNEKNGLSSLESQLDGVFASQHQLQSTYLNVALPKFKIETLLDFKEILKKVSFCWLKFVENSGGVLAWGQKGFFVERS